MPIRTPHTKDEYLKIIGEITVGLTQLEDEMARSIGRLNCEETGANIRITAGDNFQNLSRLLNVLFKYRIAESSQLARFAKIKKEMNRVNDERNINIHGVLNFLDIFSEGMYVYKHKYSKGGNDFKEDTKAPNFEELVTLSKDIEKVKGDLALLLFNNRESIKTHRKRMIEIETALESAKRNRQQQIIKNLESKIEKTQSNKNKLF